MSRAEASKVREQFLKDVAQHEMTVLRDDGVDRHLRFKRPDSSVYWFDIITWGGRLYIGGDCGTYVFDRLPDMFQFFRRDDEGRGRIDFRYWAEKIEARDKHGGVKEFDPEEFRRVIHERRVDLIRSRTARESLTKEDRRDLWERIADDVMDKADDGYKRGDVPFYFAYDFSYCKGSVLSDDCIWLRLNLDDMPSCETYTGHFLWNCYALPWAIARYDAHKAAQVPAAAGVSV